MAACLRSRLSDPALFRGWGGSQCVSDQADGNDKDKTAAGRLLNSISSIPKQCLA